MEKLPRWASGILKPTDLERLRKAVHAAEAKTTGEFVVCLVRSSSATALVPTLLALLIFGGLFFSASFARPGYDGLPWLRWLLEAGVAGLLGHFGGGLSFVQRLLVPRHERERHVHRRAHLEFYLNGLEKTKGATGILIFISLMERKAVVLADKSMASKVPAKAWEGVLQEVLAGVKQGDLADGLAKALEHSARLVAPHFPRRGKKKNELSDRLIVKE